MTDDLVQVVHLAPGAIDVATAGRAFQSGWDDGYVAGRREMLWLMAVGAACEAVLVASAADEDDLYRFYVAFTMDATSQDALQALADLGDEQAREMLR